MAGSAEELASLVEFVVVPLVDEPDAVEVTAEDVDGRVAVDIRVDPDDVGKVIGRQGRIIRSIRTLARAAASRQGMHVEVELVED